MVNENTYAEKWYDRKIPRIVLTIFFTGAASISCGLITMFHNYISVAFIVLTIIFTSLQIIFSLRCSLIDKVRELSVDNMETMIGVYQELFASLPSILDEQASGINTIANNISNDGFLSAERWTFDKATNQLCESIASFIKNYSGTDVAVCYARIDEKKEGMIKIVGYANKLNEYPSTYLVEREITNNKDVYFDIKMFYKQNLEVEYRLDSTSVDKAFYYQNPEKNLGKYEQFLFIPVSCDRKKMIGLIEVVSPKGHIIAESDEEMKNIAKLLRIYSSLFILLYKAEKAAIAIPPNPNTDNRNESEHN